MKCKRCYSEWWSLPSIQAWSTVHILKVHLAKLKCNANIEKQVKKIGITIECQVGIDDTKIELKKAQKLVKHAIAQSAEKRQEHNKKVVGIHALTGEITAEQAMKAIINAKDMANMWKKISYADKGKQDNNITSILILES
eukprot:2806361-Ditylum_brightwellii.AAC.1